MRTFTYKAILQVEHKDSHFLGDESGIFYVENDKDSEEIIIEKISKYILSKGYAEKIVNIKIDKVPTI